MVIKVRGLPKKRCSYFANRILELIDLLKLRELLSGKILSVSFKRARFSKDDFGYFQVPIHRKNKKLPYEVLEIAINKQHKFEKWLKTILHELIHVRQYLNNSLRYITYDHETYVYWKSKNIGRLKEIQYHVRPWEISARRLENYYWKKYKDGSIQDRRS